jgi:rhodanese-related sulfurtransferase
MTASRKTLIGELARVVIMAGLMAGVYNVFSIKSIPFIRTVAHNVAVSDSELFARGPADSGRIQGGVGVIAPLHDRALARADSGVVDSPKVEQVYHIISLAQLNQLLTDGHIFLVDARDSAAYRKGRIAGARNIFGLAADEHFAELVPMPRDTLTVIYCNNPECHLGRMLAEFMGAIGFKRLYLYDEGWDGWVKAKMPVDSTSPGRP